MTLQQMWTVFAFSGAVTLALASVVLWLQQNGIRPIHDVLQRYAKLKRLAQIFIALFVAQLFVYGSTKATGGSDDDDNAPDDPPASTNAPPLDWPSEGTNEPPVGGLMMSKPPSSCGDRNVATPTEDAAMRFVPRLFAAPMAESVTGFTEEQIAAEAAFVSTGTNEVWDFAPPQGATLVERWKKHGAARQRLPLGCKHPKDGPMMIDTYGRIWTEQILHGWNWRPVGEDNKRITTRDAAC